jgi:hypothetical protein
MECGKNRDGWWTNKDLITQFKQVAPLFKALHPPEEYNLYFFFDNSQNHHAKPPGALDTSKMNLSDGGAQPKMKESTVCKCYRTEFFPDGSVDFIYDRDIVQNLQTDTGSQKGAKTILQERGLWGNGMPLACQACKNSTSDTIRIEEGWFNSRCCCKGLLNRQEDFMNQKEWLSEVADELGVYLCYYPKFHCELNWIERVWGFVKSKLRRICSNSLKDLRINLPAVLDSIPLSFVRRVVRSSLRFASIYRLGPQFHGPIADFAMKKYTSHRKIPLRMDETIESFYERLSVEYNTYLATRKCYKRKLM